MCVYENLGVFGAFLGFFEASLGRLLSASLRKLETSLGCLWDVFERLWG